MQTAFRTGIVPLPVNEPPRSLPRTGATWPAHCAKKGALDMFSSLAREGSNTFNIAAGVLASGDCHRLQLRHSAGLAPASTFMPWHPGLRVTAMVFTW